MERLWINEYTDVNLSHYYGRATPITGWGELSTTALRGCSETEQSHRRAIARRQAIWEKRDEIRKN
jgi:hypothetical protein